jgi:hypothetical protein
MTTAMPVMPAFTVTTYWSWFIMRNIDVVKSTDSLLSLVKPRNEVKVTLFMLATPWTCMGSGVLAPPLLNLTANGGERLASWPYLPSPWDSRLGGPCRGGKDPLPLPGIKPRLLVCPSHSLDAVLSERRVRFEVLTAVSVSRGLHAVSTKWGLSSCPALKQWHWAPLEHVPPVRFLFMSRNDPYWPANRGHESWAPRMTMKITRTTQQPRGNHRISKNKEHNFRTETNSKKRA